MKKIHQILTVAATAACLSIPSPARAEWAPTQPVRIIVPIVGSTNDVIARLVAPHLHQALGQPVIVENKSGAGGNIGADFVAKAKPDGHTLLVGYNGPIAINKTLFSNLPFDPQKDLAPITLAVTAPQYLVVPSAHQAKTLSDFVNQAKAKPRGMSYGSVAVGSASHLTMEMFKRAANIDVVHVPYRGASPALVDLVSGTIDAAFMVPGNVQEFVKDGRLRILASTGKSRFRDTPDIPTLIESGYPDMLAISWVGFLTTGGTPQEIIDRYNKEMTKILKMPDVKRQLEGMQFEVVASSPPEFASWISQEIDRWGNVIRATGATNQ